jgi:hypothetical protein
MKKIVLVLLTVIAFAAGCSKDEKDLDKNLFGNWIWIHTLSGEGTVGDSATYFSTPETEGCGESLEFRSDGTFYWQETGCEDGGDELSKWYIKGGRLVVDDRGEKTYLDYILDSDTLKITSESEGYWEIEKWIKE